MPKPVSLSNAVPGRFADAFRSAAVPYRMSIASPAVSLGFTANRSDVTPATWGAATDVPSSQPYEPSVLSRLRIEVPGADTSLAQSLSLRL